MISLKTKQTYVDPNKVRALFEKYDIDKNGVLDKSEFIKIMVDILRDLGENLPEKKHIEVAEEGFVRFDFNKNKKIEFNEFYEFMVFVVSEKGYNL